MVEDLYLAIGRHGVDDPGLERLVLGHALDRRFFGHRQHPADLAQSLLRVEEVGHLTHVRPIFQNPIAPCQAGIQDSVFDVARHLLGADQHALDLLVVNGGEVRAGVHGDLVSRTAKELERGFLQATLR